MRCGAALPMAPTSRGYRDAMSQGHVACNGLSALRSASGLTRFDCPGSTTRQASPGQTCCCVKSSTHRQTQITALRYCISTTPSSNASLCHSTVGGQRLKQHSVTGCRPQAPRASRFGIHQAALLHAEHMTEHGYLFPLHLDSCVTSDTEEVDLQSLAKLWRTPCAQCSCGQTLDSHGCCRSCEP